MKRQAIRFAGPPSQSPAIARDAHSLIHPLCGAARTSRSLGQTVRRPVTLQASDVISVTQQMGSSKRIM
jgi:hypothetical protein